MEKDELISHFEDFLKNFLTERRKYKYRERIAELPFKEGEPVLEVDFSDLQLYDTPLAIELTEKPDIVLEAAREAAMEILRVEDARFAKKVGKVEVSFAGGAGHRVKLRGLEARYLQKLVSVEGLLVRVSQPFPLVVKAVFQCNACGVKQSIPQKGLLLQRPRQCDNEECRARKRSFTLIPEASEYVDIQFGRLQESPEELPPGQIPRFIDILLKAHLVEAARPGDPVLATGILRSRRTPRAQGSALFQYQLDINYIEPLSKEPSAISITKEEEEDFKRFAEDGDAFEKLTTSFAPSIHGMTDVKKSLLLSLFGGQEKVLPDKMKVRGDIHVLLIGDPGTAKSELLKYVAQVAPKGIFTSGRGTTAAGLTAAVIKDAGGSFSLEAGAVVLADRGLCSIDEIDKMKAEDRVALHEALEQQTVSIAKGGIVATLNARTTVVAAANPAEGRYNPNRLVSDNIKLPVTLLSRFDLIHIVKDEPSRDLDRALVDHVLEVRTREDVFKDLLPLEFMRKYIVYAKRLRPRLSDRAKELIRDFYLKMRETGSPESPISISARQLDSLMRLAEARARADLSEVVTEKHAEDAIRLVSGFLRQVGLDTESGAIDVDIIMTGVPQRRRSRTGIILSELETLQREEKGPVPREYLIDRVMDRSKLERSEIESLIDALITQGAIYEPRPGLLSTTR